MNLFNPALLSPLLYLALFFMLGIVWISCEISLLLPIFLMVIFVSISFTRMHDRRLFFGSLASLFFITGALRYEQHKNEYELFFKEIHNVCVTVEGMVSDIEPSEKNPHKKVITLALHKMYSRDKEFILKSSYLLKIIVPLATSDCKVSDYIICPDVFLRIGENENYKRYLIKENLLGHVTYSKPLEVISQPTYSLQRWIAQKRTAILENFKNNLSSETFLLCSSIFWGKKEVDQSLMNPVKDSFKIWGIVHYLARSGLHVLLFIMSWNWIFRVLPLPFIFKQWCFLLLILFYHFLSWPSVSFMRSLILFVLYKICALADLQINMLHLLALTCLIILLLNPFQLFFLDFQLSFGLTFALLWLGFLQKS